MKAIGSGVLFVAAVLVAACGGTTSASVSGTPPVTATTTSIPPVSGPSATTAAAPAGRCLAGDFSATIADSGDGAAATRYITIQVTNTGGEPCVTGGYFAVSSYDLEGHPISVQDSRVAQSGEAQFTLEPGRSLSLTIGVNDLPAGPQGSCPRVDAFHLVPPGDAASVTLSLLNASGQGTQVVECPGNILVRPATPA